jgi:hypothetical protein
LFKTGFEPVEREFDAIRGGAVKKSDWKVFSVGAVAASLTLAACGASASLDGAVSSLGASPYLQVHLTATFTGAGSQQVQQILAGFSYNVIEASTTGQALSQSVGNIDSEIDVNVANQTLLALREVGTNLYFELNALPLANIPGLGLTPQKLAAIELVVDNRWFEVPQSLITSLVPSSTPTEAQTAKEQALVQALLKSLTKVIEATPYTTLPGGGYSQTGTLASIAKAVLPVVAQAEGTNTGSSFSAFSFHTGKVHGTYTLGVTLSGSTATGGSIKVTAPNGSSGNATLEVDATVAHDTVTVAAPTEATVLTLALIKELEGQVTS